MTLVQPRGWPEESTVLDALDTAALLVGHDGTVRVANGVARAHYGADLVGRPFVETLVVDDEQAPMGEVLAGLRSGAAWRGQVQFRRVDGATQHAELTCTPIGYDDGTTGFSCIVDLEDRDGGPAENGRAARDAVRLRDRLTRLARVTAELASVQTIDEVSQVVVAHSAEAVGASIAGLVLRDPRDHATLRLVALSGGTAEDEARYATFPVSAPNPAAEAVRHGARVLVAGEAEIQRRYPVLVPRGERSLLCLPLRVGSETFGAISLTFPGPRRLDDTELEFFEILADTCAQAVERIETQKVADRQSAKLAFLADASAELASSLDYEATLAKVAQLAVPTFADWSSIDLVDDGVLRRLAVAHVDPAKVRLAHELAEKYPPDPDAPTGAWNVMRTGQSELVPEVTDELLEMIDLPEEQKQLVRDLQLCSAVTVPLVARGRVLGVLSWVSAESGRLYSEDDLALAEEVAERAAVAIDNAELHSQTLAAAVELQRAVLPASVPEVPGVDVASFYRPSGRTDVGGDFYDTIPLADGRLAVFVGDVMGRGVTAAAAMAQMRASVRAYVAVDPRPSAVMSALDRMLELYPTEQLVTLVYLLVDPATDSVGVANAGHPPPLLLHADGSTLQLPFADGSPLGTTPQVRHEHTLPLGPGDTLLLFTDGLVERRDEDIGESLQRLRDALPALQEPDLGAGLTGLCDALLDPSRNDDVAALAVRRRD